MLIRVIDFETTGFHEGAGVCEVGWTDVHEDGCDLPQSMLVNPGQPIRPDATAVTGITNDMVRDCPPTGTGFMRLMEGAPHAFAAHNAQYEQRFFQGAGTPWICTHKCAIQRWAGKESFAQPPSFKLGDIVTWLRIELDPELAFPLHRAAPDTYMTARLLQALLRDVSFDQLVAWSKQPAPVRHMPFGKHKGQSFRDIPSDYLRWVAGESESGPDLKAAAAGELLAREGR